MTTLRSLELERLDEATRRTGPAEAPSRRRPRDPWFDNIKMALVTLVVVGHSWALLPNTATESWAYDFLYSWHMPAFAIITGYFSRSFSWTPAKLWSLVCTVAVPYFVFEAAFAFYRDQVGGIHLHHLFTHPHYPMWYLAAVFVWRLAAPAFRRLPAPVALSAAVVTSLLGGFVTSGFLDPGRLLGLFPFFVLGLCLGTDQWRTIRSRAAVPWALAGLVGILVLARFTDSWISTDWYYYTRSYADLGEHGLHPVLIRAALLVIGLIAAFSVFALVPRGRSWFSTMGSATLVVYLFHGFVMQGARFAGFPDWAAGHADLAFAVTTGGAIALALTLASPPVARRLKVAVDPLGALVRRLPVPRSG